MFGLLLAAGLLAFSLGLVHSVLGEALFFRHIAWVAFLAVAVLCWMAAALSVNLGNGHKGGNNLAMEEEHPFRLILVLGCAILLPIVGYHRLKSQAAGDRLDRRQEGPVILVTLRPVGVLCMLGLIAYMVDPTWMAWSSMALPRWLRWTGVGLAIIAGSLLIWTLRSLGRNLTDAVVTRREHTLVTRGPYRLVRHPFYLSAALAIAANALAAANWFVLGTGAAALVLIAIRTRKEEELLLARFGEAYRRYMERTGRFVPKAFARQSKTTRET